MNTIIPKRVVIDTNVCLDLFVFHDQRWNEILQALQKGSLKAYTRPECRDEWLAVLKYPHLPIKAENLVTIQSQFDQLIECVAPATLSNIKLPVCSDKDDQKFLEIARDADAHFLITKDKALLKLAKRIRKLGLYSIETPENFLRSQNSN
ncbi:putative toxin-antitoxin system toxin component, PIN family [Undibacterium sp. Dicai25W]|uniref:putative toxin-antitoxin system toxin component, PIN family n=1 Tax=Undibacterium sp. Dicai25W TaxID=3413034 RepID=UPI003BF27733